MSLPLTMASKKDPLSMLKVPRLAPVRVNPDKPVIALKVPSSVVLRLPYEPFEYTSLGYMDARQNSDGSVTVETNFQPIIDCVQHYQDILEILERTHGNVETMFMHRDEDLQNSGPEAPWEIEIDVPEKAVPCIRQKIGVEVPSGINYTGNKLVFRATKFTDLVTMMKIFLQGANTKT